MKQLTEKQDLLKKIEFWAATALFVFAMFYLIGTAVKKDGSLFLNNNGNQGLQTYIELHYNQYYFFPKLISYIALYLGFLTLNFSVVPGLLKKEEPVKNTVLLILSFLAVWLVLSTADTYLKNYIFLQHRTDKEAYTAFFISGFLYTSWLLFMFGFYSVIKYAGWYLLTNSDIIQSKYRMVTRNGIAAFVLWMISMFLLLLADADKGVLVVWLVIIPFGICLYWYSFYAFIPDSLKKKQPLLSYYFRVLLVLLVSLVPLFLIIGIAANEMSLAAMIVAFNAPFQLLITAPLSWMVYRWQRQDQEEIATLKTALGQSNANFDFLRSQINPHFLFNALNTIYGTALQEKAERTSEGVERLGEMMRFMLQENMQEKIPLAREIEYLNNYISLQKLRVDQNQETGISIRSEIERPVEPLQIAPMLLIPFVENAFKHGISLREASYITISLQLRDRKLYFDVTNSIHRKADDDPERNKGGIGLNNVRQRLKLLYGEKHELIVRETVHEFFVHLTVQLD
ncbi:sensor histidine kinase [Arcticibacter tournemirensis]|uniref:Sensor histidine kinase n=1 Tax=Arcticibacter tournemirensis TaxID=699437 RepID=A0A4Q0ME30_9SPHI|nr:histidine kinase [Arcticibacter tournemirensis]RXF71678.1 sensor histidine kinase [Arcticibacter tournemirensis]